MCAWQSSKPAGSDTIKTSDENIRANWDAIETGLVPYDYIRLEAQGSDPTAVADHVLLFGKDASSKTEVHWIDEDSNSVQLTSGGLLGSTGTSATVNALTTAGLVTLGTHIKANAMPCFRAYNSSADTNQTGDGTAYTVDLDTEEYDYGSDFASDTFTAPVKGVYVFHGGVRYEGLTSSHTQVETALMKNGSTRVARVLKHPGNARDNNDALNEQITAQLLLNASDTITLRAKVNGGTKVVDINDGSDDTYLEGRLIIEVT